jgi:hypothetical protein
MGERDRYWASESVHQQRVRAGRLRSSQLLSLSHLLSIKGETLRAVLLMETFVHLHDLRALLESGSGWEPIAAAFPVERTYSVREVVQLSSKHRLRSQAGTAFLLVYPPLLLQDWETRNVSRGGLVKKGPTRGTEAPRRDPTGPGRPTRPTRATQATGRRKKACQKSGPAREGTKTAKVLAMLRQSKGAPLKELMKTAGWQAHSVRSFRAGRWERRWDSR